MVIKENKPNEELKFPCLMESTSGNVFLVIEERLSVCLINVSGGFEIGKTYSPRASKLNLYKGEITISNN